MHGLRAYARESKRAHARARARDGNAELDPAANVRPGYDCVTLTRGAAALAVVANTLAVATSFPSKSPSPGRRTGCSMGRCHAKPDCRDSPGGALLTGGLSSSDRHSSCYAYASARPRPKNCAMLRVFADTSLTIVLSTFVVINAGRLAAVVSFS